MSQKKTYYKKVASTTCPGCKVPLRFDYALVDKVIRCAECSTCFRIRLPKETGDIYYLPEQA